MKYILSFICLAAIGIVCALCGFSTPQKLDKSDYLRVHIRANSNLACDQEVKYKVKDAVVETLIPILANAHSKEQAKALLRENFSLIESTCDKVLEENNFDYSSHALLSREFFPTRVYQDLTLEEGEYDALIINLGSGQGNNWWCVVYPAFCFIQTKNSDNVVYISRIWEIIKSVLGL